MFKEFKLEMVAHDLTFKADRISGSIDNLEKLIVDRIFSNQYKTIRVYENDVIQRNYEFLHKFTFQRGAMNDYFVKFCKNNSIDYIYHNQAMYLVIDEYYYKLMHHSKDDEVVMYIDFLAGKGVL